jgi:2,3-bisphosphoglycerate-dependent phosphoglycerate mutase
MQTYFIRHGQSANNALWARTGTNIGRSQDPELTPVGREQAKCLAQFLSRRNPSLSSDGNPQNISGFDLTHLYCSPMVRAVATGTAIAEVLGLPLIAWIDLHETGGIYLADPETGERVGLPGKDRGFYAGQYPDLVVPEAVASDGWWNRPFETREERPGRAQRVVRQLLERHGDTEDRVALVSHGGFYQHFLAAVISWPMTDVHWFGLNNAAITRIDFSDQVVIRYANRADFLPSELIT